MRIFNIEGENKISGLILAALALFPILRPALQSILIVAFCLISVFLYRKTFLERTKGTKAIPLFLILCGYYLWYAITLFWSDDMSWGVQHLQSNLLLLLFPFIFVFFHPIPNASVRNRVQEVFIGAMLIYTFFWFQSYITGISYFQNLRLKEEFLITDLSFWEQVQYFINNGYYRISGSATRGFRLAGEENKLFAHHAYISAYLLAALAFCLNLFKVYKKRILQILLIISAVFFSSIPDVSAITAK